MQWRHQYNLELWKITHMVSPTFHLFLLLLERLPHTILVQSLYHQLAHLGPSSSPILLLQSRQSLECF